MTPLSNTGFMGICGNCDCPGFVPSVNWSYNAGTKALTITDASTFPTGDGMGALNVTATDGAGHTVSGRISTAGGNVVLDMTTNGVVIGPGGINIRATIVTTHRCTADLASYNIGAAANGTGALGNKNLEGDADGSLS